MSKQNLISLINKSILHGENSKLKSNIPGLYEKAVLFLNKMKLIVESDAVINKDAPISATLDGFITHELELYDRNYAKELSKVTYAFDEYYDLIDPDLKSLFEND